MTDVLGFELNRARLLVEQEGAKVCCVEVSSRKGVKGNEARVVRQRILEDGTVELNYSIFKTDDWYVGG